MVFLIRLIIVILVGKKGLNIILGTHYRFLIQISCQISPIHLWSAKHRILDGLNVKIGFYPRSYYVGVYLLLPAEACRAVEHEHRRPGDVRLGRYPPR